MAGSTGRPLAGLRARGSLPVCCPPGVGSRRNAPRVYAEKAAEAAHELVHPRTLRVLGDEGGFGTVSGIEWIQSTLDPVRKISVIEILIYRKSCMP